MTARLGLLAILLLASSAAWAGSASTSVQPWNQRIINGKRFNVPKQWDGGAVFDRETGLLWQRAVHPDALYAWEHAVLACAGLSIAERRGWHLPSIVELSSLLDTVVDGIQATGFWDGNVRLTYWSSTPHLSDPTKAYVTDLAFGELRSDVKTSGYPVLCVRSPVNVGAAP